MPRGAGKDYRRRRPPVTLARTLYDRRAEDIPKADRFDPDIIVDACQSGDSDVRKLPALRGGSLATTGDGEWLVPSGQEIIVSRQTRHDPLGWLKAKRLIDEGQFAAGRRWQELHEGSELGGVKGFDYSRIVVDGGELPEALTERQRFAIYELARIEAVLAASDRMLGTMRVVILRDVLATGLRFNQVAASRNLDKKLLAREFRAALSILAVEFGFTNQPIAYLRRQWYVPGHNRKITDDKQSGDRGCTGAARGAPLPVGEAA